MLDVANTPLKYEARVFIGSETIHLDAADGAGGWKRFAEYRAARNTGAAP